MIELINPQEISSEEVEHIWQSLSSVEIACDDRLRGRGDLFVLSMFHGTAYVKLGNFGIASACNVVPNGDATVHFVIWDRSQPLEVVRTCKEALRLAFDQYNLHRVTTTIAEQNSDSLRVARLLGFQEEGRLRQAFLFKGQFHDMIVLGVLRSDLFDEVSAPESEPRSTEVN